MVLNYKTLSENPGIFRDFTGISIAEFVNLYRKLEPVYQERERKRLSRRNRQRAIGGGSDYTLSLQDRLLMTLVWMRLYLTTSATGFLFGVHKSTVSRNTRAILACLEGLGEDTLGWDDRPGKSRSVAEVMREYSDMLAIVDATEQRVERSKDYETQKKHYSGKKKTHTRKTQIIVNEHGVIRHVSRSVPGSMNDLELFRQSGAVEQIPETVTVGGDKGYQGMHNVMPEQSVVTPHKASRGHPLDEEQKRMNREYSSIRIVVENTICALKHFRILADRFRHAMSLYDAVFMSVVALVNPRIARQVTEALASFVTSDTQQVAEVAMS